MSPRYSPSRYDDGSANLAARIAARVKERLQTDARAQVTPSQPCNAGAGQCIGCGWSISRRKADAKRIVDSGACRVSARPGAGEVSGDLARYIDHTLLKADATKDQLRSLCEDARKYAFASVCVNPSNVAFCYNLLRSSSVAVCTVIGFPLGATTPETKVHETREAVRNGASEIDMVINIGALKSRDYALVLDDIRGVVQAAGSNLVKVILETGGLTEHEKVIGCALSKSAGAHFVKTSTGFGPGGATVDDVRLMKAIVGAELEVKASGGVRSADDVRAMIDAGATRIGASASVAIVTGKASGAKGY